jgi:hypothetical protein
MTSIERVGKNAPLDWVKFEADVTAAIPARSLMPINSAPPVQSDAIPDYVERQDGVPRVGALSAEAMVRDHESAAKEIEAMGAELISAAMKCEAMTSEVHNAIAYICARSRRRIARKPRRSSSASRSARCLPKTFARRARLSNVELKQAISALR